MMVPQVTVPQGVVDFSFLEGVLLWGVVSVVIFMGWMIAAWAVREGHN